MPETCSSTPHWPATTSFAVDFESTYSKGKRDISTLGTAQYLRHQETKIYLVSIYGVFPDGTAISYSGPVEQAPWHRINGHHWVSHNAAFDAQVFIECLRRGQAPEDVAPSAWDCTADLAAFLGSGRSLAAACEFLLGVTVDKTVRDEMNNKTWETMTPEFRQAAIDYALNDAKRCWELWQGYGAQWPAKEVAISRHTADMVIRGIHVDSAYVDEGISTLNKAIFEVEGRIPWLDEKDAKGKFYTVGSKKAMAKACVAAGIPPPTSTADKNELFDRWCEQFADRAPFVAAVKEHRSINRTIDVLEKIRDRTLADGRMPYGLKYFGAHTGRFSGDSGLNLHNLTKKKIAGVDLRGCLVPAPGKKFIVADLKQIEARVSLWFAEDWAQLELLRNGMDVYEAHARQTMGYKDPMPLSEWVKLPERTDAEKNVRQIAKARVLGLGFGMGHARLIDYAKAQLGLELTVQQAKAIVNGFRNANRGIVHLWNKLGRAMETHAGGPNRHAPFVIELPSWRQLEYYDVNSSDGLQARDEIGGRMNYYHGPKLAENVVQATARDVLVEAILRIESVFPGSVVLHVHDEVVCEVDLSVDPAEIEALMSVTPDWVEGLPVGSSVEEAERYFK
jgi:hypothetical protein